MDLSDIFRPLEGYRYRILAEKEASGTNKITEKLKKLSRRELKGFGALLRKVQEHGPTCLSSDVCHEADSNESIYQFRKGDYRLFWFYDQGSVIICSHISRKKGNKTSKKDKERAIGFRRNYFSAKESGTLRGI